MIIFETLEQYEKQAKIGDVIVLAGRGIIDGIGTCDSKHQTHKVSKIAEDGQISIKAYRGRTNYKVGASHYDQKVALLTKKEFNQLPILY